MFPEAFKRLVLFRLVCGMQEQYAQTDIVVKISGNHIYHDIQQGGNGGYAAETALCRYGEKSEIKRVTVFKTAGDLRKSDQKYYACFLNLSAYVG